MTTFNEELAETAEISGSVRFLCRARSPEPGAKSQL
jgi:hypothetical protein